MTITEVQADFLDQMNEPQKGEQSECVFKQIEARARAAGDSGTLDPTTVEFLPAEGWDRLDSFGRRIILAQVIVTKALMVCD